MPVVRKNPMVRDYFLEVPEVTLDPATAKPVLELVEQGKVLVFPNLRPKVDFDFWAALDTGPYPGLAKLNTVVTGDGDSAADAAERAARLRKAGVPDALADRISTHMASLLRQVLPVYRKLFEGYRFTKGNMAWRLNDIYATKMHIDCYPQPLPDHMARMFINLDNQPRIWHTSWHVDELIEQVRGKIPEEQLRSLSANDLWTAFNKQAFGESVNEWWMEVQRHAVFFHPGDVWVVDSRMVGHQIFYGRRALSIDFVVDKASMLDPHGHYLERAEAARHRLLSPVAA
jgi:hypothetical protein